jgi:predicted DNA binding protein
MSVILEFSIATGNFRLGRVLSGPAGMRFELERVVPTGQRVLPFVWATGDDHAAFQSAVRTNSAVKELHVLDRVDGRGLYRIEWDELPTDLIAAIAAAGGSILRAIGHENWSFRLRFPTHEDLSQFHDNVLEHGLTLHVDRTYTLSGSGGHGDRFDLTRDQREALLLALERGYFATPREAGLDELADELDISRQAVSNRIRRGNEKVLREALLSAASNASDS